LLVLQILQRPPLAHLSHQALQLRFPKRLSI
jgi:hypothetical protein